MKIIGIELRVQFHDARKGPQQKEIGIVPCNIEVHIDKPEAGYYSGQLNGNGTLHTDCGDLGFQFNIPDCFLDREFTKSRLEAKQEL